MTRAVKNRVIIPERTETPIVINGDMQIAQRGTSTASVSSGSTYPALDRFLYAISDNGTFTVSQDTDTPTGQGFSKSLKLDCTTADASVASGSFQIIEHRLEGQNLQLLKKGTSSAESLTVEFWVKSTKTGTFILEIEDSDNGRSISQAYTVSSSNTWEKKVLSFAGDTTGALDNDNARSLRLMFWLGAGSNFTTGSLATSWASTGNNRAVGQVNSADSTDNNFFITGIQAEVGDYNTDTIPQFQFEDRATSLARCQRYYQNQGNNFYGLTEGTDKFRFQVPFDRPMRAAPTITARGTGFKFNARYLGDHTTDNPTISDAASTTFGTWLGVNGTSLTAGTPIYGRSQQDAAGQFLALDSEL